MHETILLLLILPENRRKLFELQIYCNMNIQLFVFRELTKSITNNDNLNLCHSAVSLEKMLPSQRFYHHLSLISSCLEENEEQGAELLAYRNVDLK